jgi:hypothetical protein
MIWQFEELGYDVSIDYGGRTSSKPIRWNYYNEPPRKKIYNFISSLLYLRQNYPAFTQGSFTLSQFSGGRQKRINISHAEMDVVVLGNFDVISASLSGEFTQTGYWYNYFTGDSIDVVSVSSPIALAPGESRLYTTERIINPGQLLSVKDIFKPDYDNSWVNIYPNPVTDYFTISTEGEAIYGSYQIDIIDLSGRHIKSLSSEEALSGSPIDVSSLNPGTYLVRISGEGRVAVKRLIIR